MRGRGLGRAECVFALAVACVVPIWIGAHFKGHSLLGQQVAYFAVFLPLSLGLIFCGFQTANRGLDLVERGNKLQGAVWFWGSVAFVCGSGALLPAGHWFFFARDLGLL